MNKVWEIKERKYDDIIKQLLYNRGVDVSKLGNIHQFLSPDFNQSMIDPYLLPDMQKAVDRIRKAMEQGEKVGIFADYDADGIPGAAFMAKTLERLRIPYEVFIPSRENGYGLSVSGIDYLIEKGASLIITVDLGIRNHKEAAYCCEKNVDLIITDHHIPEEKLPKCVAVVNPKISSSKYPFRELSGAGVAYKLAFALNKYYPDLISESFLKWNLDLIAISTISDVVPLCQDNRTICHYGLKVLRKSKNLGIQSLIEVAKIDQKNLKAYNVGFQIGPRINAPGRIDHATKSYQILVTKELSEAKDLAKWLDGKNTERQESMDRIQEEACQKIAAGNMEEDNVIVVKGKDWPKGVIGPTASRLAEKFNRPVIILSQKDDVITGSARSLPGINIVEVLEKAKKFVVKFGGHAGAAGLSLKSDQFEQFKKSIEKSAALISEEDLIPKIKIDMPLKIDEINIKLIDELNKLEPYGMGNPKPVFVTSEVILKSFRVVGKEENHISMIVGDDGTEMKAIFFNCEYKEKIKSLKNSKISIVYNLAKDEWNGNARPSLNIIDLKVLDA